MHVTITHTLSAHIVRHHFARQNISKQRKRIVKLFVVDALVKILDENVTDSTAPQGRIALTPHDTAGVALDHGVIHGVEGSFGVRDLMEIHVRVSEGSAGHGITTDTDGGHGTDGVEDLEKKAFVDIGFEVTHVEGGGVERLLFGGLALAGVVGDGWGGGDGGRDWLGHGGGFGVDFGHDFGEFVTDLGGWILVTIY